MGNNIFKTINLMSSKKEGLQSDKINNFSPYDLMINDGT